MGQFAGLIIIAEMTPGAIAINSATFIGTRMAGFSGALIAAFGCVLPSFVLVLLLSFLYIRYWNLKGMQGILTGLRPAVVAMIAGAGMSLLLLAIVHNEARTLPFSDFRIVKATLFLGSFLLLRKQKINPVLMISGTGILGTSLYMLYFFLFPV